MAAAGRRWSQPRADGGEVWVREVSWPWSVGWGGELSKADRMVGSRLHCEPLPPFDLSISRGGCSWERKTPVWIVALQTAGAWNSHRPLQSPPDEANRDRQALLWELQATKICRLQGRKSSLVADPEFSTYWICGAQSGPPASETWKSKSNLIE